MSNLTPPCPSQFRLLNTTKPGLIIHQIDGSRMGINSLEHRKPLEDQFRRALDQEEKQLESGVLKDPVKGLERASLKAIKSRILGRCASAVSLKVNQTHAQFLESARTYTPIRPELKNDKAFVQKMNEKHLTFEYMDGTLLPAQGQPGSKGDLVIYSADGVAMLYLFRQGLGMHLKRDDDSHQDQIIQHLEKGLADRVTAARSKPPTGLDGRHEDFEGTKAMRDAAGHDCGVAHYGAWSPIGQGYVIGTADTRGGGSGNTSNAADQLPDFYDDLGPMFQGLGLAFSAIDPLVYRQYRVAFNRYVGEIKRRQVQVPVDNMAWLSFAHLTNIRVLPHLDTKDAKHGWVGMTPVGEFEGGDLVLPQLELRVKYQPGDICLFRSSILEHAITPFVGQRSAIVLFTHQRDLMLTHKLVAPGMPEPKKLPQLAKPYGSKDAAKKKEIIIKEWKELQKRMRNLEKQLK